MNENQIETFFAILACGTFSSAARMLNVTQPTVTSRIHALEEVLGAELFIRGRAEASLTPAGQALLPMAERLRRAYTDLRRAVRPYGWQRELVIGFPDLMIQGNCAAYHAVIRLGSKDLHLRSRLFLQPEEVRKALLDGNVDLAFADVSTRFFDTRRFARRVLFDSAVYLCVHRGHRLASRTAASPEELVGETVLAYRDSTFFTRALLERLTSAKLAVRPTDVPVEEAVRLLRPDSGVLLTNLRLVREPWLIYRPLKLSPGLPAGLVWLKSHQDDALLRLTEQIAALPCDLWRK